MAAEPLRSDLVPRAVRLEWLTAMWMLIEAAVAIGSGIAAHSLSLIAFGADSLIELASGCCSAVAASCGAAPGGGVPREGRASSEPSRRRTPLCPRRLYRREQRLQLMDARGQEFSTPGLALALLAIKVMWLLARAKMRLADELGSRALRADAVESITCGYLSGIVVIGLLVQFLMPEWWWIDSAASLAIVVLLIKEGREAWEGRESETAE